MFHEIVLKGEMECFYLLFSPRLLFTILCICYFSISRGLVLFLFFFALEPV